LDHQILLCEGITFTFYFRNVTAAAWLSLRL